MKDIENDRAKKREKSSVAYMYSQSSIKVKESRDRENLGESESAVTTHVWDEETCEMQQKEIDGDASIFFFFLYDYALLRIEMTRSRRVTARDMKARSKKWEFSVFMLFNFVKLWVYMLLKEDFYDPNIVKNSGR